MLLHCPAPRRRCPRRAEQRPTPTLAPGHRAARTTQPGAGSTSMMQNRTKYTEQKPKIKLLADGSPSLLSYNVLVCPCQRQRQTQTRSTSHAICCLTKLLTFPAVFAPNSNHSILDQKAKYGRMNADVYTVFSQQTMMNNNVCSASTPRISPRDKFHAPSSPAQIVCPATPSTGPATPAGTSSGPRRHSAPTGSTASASRLADRILFTYSTWRGER
jgi:hypothetical protein